MSIISPNVWLREKIPQKLKALVSVKEGEQDSPSVCLRGASLAAARTVPSGARLEQGNASGPSKHASPGWGQSFFKHLVRLGPAEAPLAGILPRAQPVGPLLAQ